MRRFVLSVALLGAVTLTAGQSLTITPSNPTLTIGGPPVQLTANGPHIQWSISDPLVATLSPSGLVAGRSVGKTLVFARARNGREGSTTVTVVDTPPPPPEEVCGDGIDNDGDGLIDENPPCAPPPPPPSGERGPQPTLACPSGAVRIAAGENIQSFINANAAGTTYCLLAGSHAPTAPIRPKTGDTLQGEYGAIINGQNVTQSFDAGGTAVISGWNCGASCSDITVRNLYIRGRDLILCVAATGAAGGGWIVENNDIQGCRWGVNHFTPWASQLPQSYSRGWKVRNNVIAGNIWSGATGSDGSGAYGFANADDVLFENNELFGNGGQPKFTSTRRAVVRGNWVHHNGFGIWFDGDNLDAVIENNTLEDNEADGVECEISSGCIIRNNIARRNGFGAATGSGIFISTTRDSQVYGNTLEHNFRDINLFVNCDAVRPAGFFYPTQIEYDLRNVSVHDNFIKVGGPEFTVWGPSFNHHNCGANLPLYADPNNVKNNRFTNNTYQVTNTAGFWWVWNGFKTFSQWQALGHDATGSVSQ